MSAELDRPPLKDSAEDLAFKVCIARMWPNYNQRDFGVYPNQELNPDPNRMLDVWCWTLSWFLKPPSSAEKRARQSMLVESIKAELRTIESIKELQNRYQDRGSQWCIKMAKQMYPSDWPTIGISACTAAAYGVRYVEMVTNSPLDARQELPKWVGEWAIW